MCKCLPKKNQYLFSRDGQYRIVCDILRKKTSHDENLSFCDNNGKVDGRFSRSPLMLSHSTQLTPPPVRKRVLAHACLCQREERPERPQTSPSDAADLSVSTYCQAFITNAPLRFCRPLHCCCFAVGLIKEDLILSCKGREPKVMLTTFVG